MSATPRMLRIAFFGSHSRLSLRALDEVTSYHSVVMAAIAEPKSSGFRRMFRHLARLRGRPRLPDAVRRHHIPVIAASPENELAIVDRLHQLQPDLICIAVFPRRIREEAIGTATLGAINVHPSLLPRHRGPLPIFWTYYSNDDDTGVTVHHASQRLDAGDIILQDSFSLPRGYPATQLNEDLALRGGRLLRLAADELARGHAPRIVQDENAATYAPRVKLGASMVQFDTWDVERVWHFLHGLCPRYCEPLTDDTGRAVLYRDVGNFQRGPAGVPGTVQRDDKGWRLHCCGGTVFLASPSPSRWTNAGIPLFRLQIRSDSWN